MEVRVLCVGDVVGSCGRRALREGLDILVPERDIHCVIVNAENTAAGSGLTAPLFEKIRRYGADLVTLGDHIYRRRDIYAVLEKSDRIVRPANLPPGAPGREFAISYTPSNHGVAVVSLLGRMYMKQMVDCPFRAIDRVLAAIPKDIRIVIVDVHAEATSEKVAMGWHLDGRVSAVFGTHTHVPTADERVLPLGTAYITDLGMTGSYDSVLGRLKDRVLKSMISGVPSMFDVAERDARLCGIILRIDSDTGRAAGVERVMLSIPDEPMA